MIIPALILLLVVELGIRENGVKGDYARLDQEGTYKEKLAVESLVRGCKEQKEIVWLPIYLAERIFGNCRPLYEAPLKEAKLSNANLRSANLRSANLISANLRSADLRSANLISADLRNANLISADLSNANLISADLSNADLSNANLISANLNSANLNSAILLNTDLRKTKSLPQAQLEGKEQPLICNSPLPQNIKIDLNRDCDRVAAALLEKLPQRFSSFEEIQRFSSLEEIQKFVDEQRQKKWD